MALTRPTVLGTLALMRHPAIAPVVLVARAARPLSLLGNPMTQARTWDYVEANWPALVAKVGPRGDVELFFRAPANDVEMARKTQRESFAAWTVKR